MPRPIPLTWGFRAAGDPMGQQRYENELMAELRRLADPREFSFRSVAVQSLRGAHPDARRVPEFLSAGLGYRGASALGAATWRTRGLVHRMDTRLPPSPGAELLTVHDMAPLRYTDEGSLTRSWQRGLLRARVVIAPSQFAADEISRLTGRPNVEVVHNGVTIAFLEGAQPLTESERLLLGLGGEFFLSVGGATKRKNLSALARAWSALSQEFPELRLALVGPLDPRRSELFAGLPRVVEVGRVADNVLPRLFASASLLVSPSEYEGFGLPCLEAMATGLPVVTADSGASKEICHSAAVHVGPDAADMARGIRDLWHAPDRRAAMKAEGLARARHFTWARSAERHLQLYRKVADRSYVTHTAAGR